MIIDINYQGILFNPYQLKEAFKEAINKTVIYGVDVAGSFTPVRTKNLKNNWDSDTQGNIFDDVYYGKFVDDGTIYFTARNITGKSVPIISDEFISNVIEVFY